MATTRSLADDQLTQGLALVITKETKLDTPLLEAPVEKLKEALSYYQNATALFEQALSEESKNETVRDEIYCGLVKCHYEIGRVQVSLDHLPAAIESFKKASNSYTQLKQHTDKAVEEINKNLPEISKSLSKEDNLRGSLAAGKSPFNNQQRASFSSTGLWYRRQSSIQPPPLPKAVKKPEGLTNN